MKKYVRTKLVFTGTEETLKPLMQKLTSADGSAPISFAAIIPLNDAGMEESWGVSREPEELDSILCHNNTVLEYSFDTLEKAPLPVFRKLAETYPGYHMTIKFASEEYGENCGIYESKEGEKELSFLEPDDPFVFACEIWDVDPDEEMQERMINFAEE